MLWTNLLDHGTEPEVAEVLDAWDDFVESLVGEPLEPGQTASATQMTAQLGEIRAHDWFDLVLDEDLGPMVYLQALSRLHRRTLPLAVPVLEAWSALRLLAGLDTSAARDLLAGLTAGDVVAVLDVGSLFHPGQSGWVPFGADVTVLTAYPNGEGVELRRIDVGAGTPGTGNAPDPTLAAVAVQGEGTVLGTLAANALSRMRGELLVAQSCALAGQAEAMLIATMDYLRTREQFGVPVGSFQALRHRAADIATDTYAAHRMARHAAERLAEHSDPLALGLLAKSFVGAAALRTASEAIQLHGGMGFTWEGGVHFGLKRVMHLAMTGPTVGECDERLGSWATENKRLLWAGGLDEAATTPEREEDN
jgi:alkylation response protein AidB-like acyl-CoA dehydrogenase